MERAWTSSVDMANEPFPWGKRKYDGFKTFDWAPADLWPIKLFFQMDEKCKSFWMDGWLQRSCLRVLLVVPDKNKQTNNKNSNLTT